MLFRKFLKNLIKNHTKYWLTKAVNFTVDQLKLWLEKWYSMHSVHNEGKSVIAERFIYVNLKKKIFINT